MYTSWATAYFGPYTSSSLDLGTENDMRIIDTKIARSTGASVTVLDAEGWQELDEPGFRWIARCDDHLWEVSVEVRRECHALAAEPEAWCPPCAGLVDVEFVPEFALDA